MPIQFPPAPASSIIQMTNNPGLYSSTLPSVSGLSGLGYFSQTGSPFLPSDISEIILMTQNAYLGANVEIGGNLTVDGQFSVGADGTLSSTTLAISPGPLMVEGSSPSSALVFFQNLAPNPSVPTVQIAAAAAGDRALGTFVTGDPFQRWKIDSNGQMQWGSGSIAQDVSLFRSTTGTLTIQPVGAATASSLPGGLIVTGAGSIASLLQATNTQTAPSFPTIGITTSATGDRAFGVEVTGDANHRFSIDSVGVHSWGPGSTTRDIQLSRTTTGVLTLISPTGAVGSLTIAGSNPSTAILDLQNSRSAPVVPTLNVQSTSATDASVGISILTDINYRMQIDSAGKHTWGTGGGATDTNLFRQGSGTLRTDNNFSVGGTISGGANTLAVNIQPDGVAAAGSTGFLADAGHVHQEHSTLTLYTAQTGTTAETLPRQSANTNAGPITSSAAYARAIGLPSGLVVNSVNFNIGGSAASGVTHGWYGIADSNRIVRAVSSDQGSTTIWGTTNTTVPVSVGYTVPSAGLYYLLLSITCSASTVPTVSAAGNLTGGLAGNAPVLYGTVGTISTPPAVGSTLSTLSANNGFNFYAYTS